MVWISSKNKVSETTSICLSPFGNSRKSGYVKTIDFIFSFLPSFEDLDAAPL